MTKIALNTARLTLCALASGFLVVGPAWTEDKGAHMGGNHPATHQGSQNTSGSQSGSGQSLDQAMKSGMDAMQKVPMSGDVDKDFAAMMRAHHQQAVAMAEIELRDGKSTELKSMASKMIKDQKKEIDKLGQWLSQHP